MIRVHVALEESTRAAVEDRRKIKSLLTNKLLRGFDSGRIRPVQI